MRPDLAPLAALSARLGRDPEQVQAAGGNTSMKHDGVIWVKASGFWLADADSKDIFVPVAIDPVRQGVAAGNGDPVPAAVRSDLNPSGLRPSIETSLHAVMPQRFVVHTHSVRTIALAVREDRDAILADRLAGLAWTSVPYAMPGLPLTYAIASAIDGKQADVLVLGNHGLVVAGETLEAVEALLIDVEQRLDASASKFDAVPGGEAPVGLRPVAHRIAHALAFDKSMRTHALAGSLYPDHVIFLGRAASTNPHADDPSKLHVLAGKGVFLPSEAGRSADEMALCLALVLARIPADARLSYLEKNDENALLDWEAEKYRQSIAKA